MKSTLLNTFTLLGLTFFISACSDSGKPSDILISSSSNSATIEVERGPVKQANVIDANGKLAKDYSGSNFYIFDSLPTYPLSVTEGIIEINNDINKTVILDINMSSYKNVITPLTTILSDDNKSKRKALESKLMSDYSLTIDDLYQSPSTSKNENIALLTNLIYKKAKESSSSITNLFSYKTLITDSNTTLKDEFDYFFPIIDANDSLKTDGSIDPIKLENYFYDINKSLFTKIDDFAILPFREFNRGDNVEKIWKLNFEIYSLADYNNFDIGIKIIKHDDDGSNDIIEFVYSGLNMVNGVLSNPTRIDVYALGDSGSGRTYFNSQFNTGNILENSITLKKDTMALNLGYIMKEQNLIVDASIFQVNTQYDINIVSSLPIFKYSLQKSLSLINNKYDFRNKKGMYGELIIK